jgi:hypothetical protein
MYSEWPRACFTSTLRKMETDVTQLPEWIREPVQLALSDLQEPGAGAADVAWQADGDDAGTLVLGDASQRFERDAAIPANVIVAVATWLQSELAPDRPACPEHDHPLQARSLYDVPWWFCPATDSPVQVVGES